MSFEKEQRNIEELKKTLELKEKVFDLIRLNTKESKDEAKDILERNQQILSYFIKFKSEPDEKGRRAGRVVLLHLGGWELLYNPYCESEIQEDFEKLKREISEREYLLQQRISYRKQYEFNQVIALTGAVLAILAIYDFLDKLQLPQKILGENSSLFFLILVIVLVYILVILIVFIAKSHTKLND